MNIRRALSPILVSAVVLVACAPAAPAPSGGAAPPAPAKPAVEQKAVFGFSNMASTMDPHKEIGLNGRRYDLYDCLVLPDDRGDPQPAIATSWKILDPTTWQFTIRTDMKWHDGTPLTAEDIKWSLDRVVNPANRLAAASRIGTLESTTIVNQTTVNLKTKSPDPILLRRLAATSILPKVYLEKVTPAEFELKPIGSGPFKMKEYRPGDTIVLSAFDEHPFRKPILREVTIKNIPEVSARVAGLQTGDLDFINLIPAEQAERLKTAGFETLIFAAGTSIGYFIDSVQGDKPHDGPQADKRVRQAINYAVDKEAIAKQIFRGFTKPEGQMAQPETFGYSPSIQPYPFDPKKAKELLAAAGYPNGFKLKIESATSVGPEFQPMSLLIQQYLKDVGIEAEFELIADVAIQREKFYGTKPRPNLLGIPLSNRPGMDADYSITWFWSKQTAATPHYNNPDFDRAYEASMVEMDSAKRRELLQRALTILNEDPPFLYIVAGASLDVYSSKRLKGAAPWVEREPRFDKLERIG